MTAERTALLGLLGLCGLVAIALVHLVYWPLYKSPLAAVPGPKLFALTRWRLALEDYRGSRTRCIQSLHQQYGAVLRIGPDEVSFSSLTALRAVYGAGSSFERTSFYRMFDVYGRQNLFSFGPARQHANRKKLIAHAYSKTAVVCPDGLAVPLISRNVRSFLDLLDQHPTAGEQEYDIFRILHWFSLDSITGFLYGDSSETLEGSSGGTNALRGRERDQRLLDDIIDPARRRLSWFAIHLPAYTSWLYSRTGLVERLVAGLGLLPMPKPATYTAIRSHALRSWKAYEEQADKKIDSRKPETATSIMQRLQQHRERFGGFDGLDIASELADHFLAGIDTTSDTTMFAIWALSQPEHIHYQARLQAEIAALGNGNKSSSGCVSSSLKELDDYGNPTADAAGRLPFLDAVLRETLRLYAPLPASEPRVLSNSTGNIVVDGVPILSNTIVSMDPYTMHRNPDVFHDPLAFRPERWLGDLGDVAQMRRWFWAFSSGARMCIGIHLATVEMTMLLSAVYRHYSTSLPQRQQGVSPGVDSRFEVISDSTFSRVSEHECWIKFTPMGQRTVVSR